MTPQSSKTIASTLRSLGSLPGEMPKLHVDDLGVIWSSDGEELWYGFAVEVARGTDTALAGSTRRNQLTDQLRAFIRSLEEGIYVQVVYDRRPLAPGEVDDFFTAKDVGHSSGLPKHQKDFLRASGLSESAFVERVILTFRYSLGDSIYKPWSLFKEPDEERMEATRNQLSMRKEAILNQLKAMGIEACHLGADEIRSFLFESLNPTRAQ